MYAKFNKLLFSALKLVEQYLQLNFGMKYKKNQHMSIIDSHGIAASFQYNSKHREFLRKHIQ